MGRSIGADRIVKRRRVLPVGSSICKKISIDFQRDVGRSWFKSNVAVTPLRSISFALFFINLVLPHPAATGNRFSYQDLINRTTQLTLRRCHLSRSGVSARTSPELYQISDLSKKFIEALKAPFSEHLLLPKRPRKITSSPWCCQCEIEMMDCGGSQIRLNYLSVYETN